MIGKINLNWRTNATEKKKVRKHRTRIISFRIYKLFSHSSEEKGGSESCGGSNNELGSASECNFSCYTSSVVEVVPDGDLFFGFEVESIAILKEFDSDLGFVSDLAFLAPPGLEWIELSCCSVSDISFKWNCGSDILCKGA